MVYTNRPSQTTERRTIETNHNAFDYGDRIHWGAIFAGLVVAIATQLLLSAIGSVMSHCCQKQLGEFLSVMIEQQSKLLEQI